MPARPEVLGNRTIRREKPLCLAWGLEPLHAPLPLAGRLMGVLRSVIEISMLPVFDTGQALPLRRPIAFEFIGDEHPWDVLASFEELAEELLRRLLMAPTLREDIEDSAVLVHGPPQIGTFLVDRDKHLI